MGAGLLFLFAGDRPYSRKIGVVLRVVGYGFLMVKPQGGLFIVTLYVLSRRDWKGLLISVVVYGLFFWRLYPDWLRVVLTDPPPSQTEAAHTLWGKFGPAIAIPVAIWVAAARPWRYWQLGGALAGILAPYGMPGIPIFLTLTAVDNLVAVPIVIVYSGCLAVLTWISPPSGVDFYTFTGNLMAIYHLGMMGLALLLACYSTRDDTESRQTNELADQLKMRISVLMSNIANLPG